MILSNIQSRATLWVLDTCLIVGLRPLMTILVTASLSSKMYSWDSLWEECVLVTTWSTPTQLVNLLFSGDILGLGFGSKNYPNLVAPVSWWLTCLGWVLSSVECRTLTTLSQRSRANNPSTCCPASRKMTPHVVELCETKVCFLAHPTGWDKSSTSKNTHTTWARYPQRCTNGIHHEKSLRSQEPDLQWTSQYVWSSFALVRVWSLILLQSPVSWVRWFCNSLCRSQYINYNVPQIKSR